MKTRTRDKLHWTLPLALAVTTAANAAEICVETTRGVGLSPEEEHTVTELVRIATSESGQTLLPEGTHEGCGITLKPKLLRLQSQYVVSLQRWEGGKQTFATQLKAASLDELDQVSTRLVRAVLAEKPAQREVHVDDVTEAEANQGTARRPTRNGTYLGIGPVLLGALSTDGVGVNLHGGYAWDINRVLLQLDGDLAFQKAAFWVSGALGGKYFLSLKDLAPYVSLELGYGVAKVNQSGLLGGESTSGFTAGGGVGVHLLRTTAVNLSLGIRTTLLFSSTVLGTPTRSSLDVTLYF